MQNNKNISDDDNSDLNKLMKLIVPEENYSEVNN